MVLRSLCFWVVLCYLWWMFCLQLVVLLRLSPRLCLGLEFVAFVRGSPRPWRIAAAMPMPRCGGVALVFDEALDHVMLLAVLAFVCLEYFVDDATPFCYNRSSTCEWGPNFQPWGVPGCFASTLMQPGGAQIHDDVSSGVVWWAVYLLLTSTVLVVARVLRPISVSEPVITVLQQYPQVIDSKGPVNV